MGPRPARRALLLASILLGAVTPHALAADPGQTLRLTYGSGQSAYPYVVYVPSTYDSAKPTPLLVMTHGCQTTADQQMRANLFNPIAERDGFVVLYPDVDAAEASQPGPLRNCWQFPLPTSWHRDAGDPAAIAGMTRAVMARWQIDPERVYMAGMSAGSFMTSIMAAAYPDLFAAVAINAGGAYADGVCLGVPLGIPVQLSAQMARIEMGARGRIVPRLVSGGDADQGIPPACADKALEQGLRTDNLVLGGSQEGPISLQAASVREVPKPGGYSTTVSTYRDPAGCVIGERWLIHGMNHFWPGGSTDPKLKSFTDPKGPNGAELTWAFLRRYTKSATAMPCAEGPPLAPLCRARWLTLRSADGATATVNGRRAKVRRRRGHISVRLPAGRRESTRVVVRAGARRAQKHSYSGCGPGAS